MTPREKLDVLRYLWSWPPKVVPREIKTSQGIKLRWEWGCGQRALERLAVLGINSWILGKVHKHVPGLDEAELRSFLTVVKSTAYQLSQETWTVTYVDCVMTTEGSFRRAAPNEEVSRDYEPREPYRKKEEAA
jgi:hypothetical protein